MSETMRNFAFQRVSFQHTSIDAGVCYAATRATPKWGISDCATSAATILLDQLAMLCSAGLLVQVRPSTLMP